MKCSRFVATCTLAAVALALPACKKSKADGGGLPDPTGGALPQPDIPQVPTASSANSPSSNSDKDGFHGTGTLQPKEEAQLGPKASGVLTAIAVEEGDDVKKGQFLFRLDSRQAGLAVEQAKAQVTAAKVGLSAAELDYKRTKELFDRGSVAPAIHDASKSRLDGAKTSVKQAEVALSLTKKMAGDMSVHSPIKGVVTAKLKNVGETVTMMPPTIVLVVQDVSALELRARLPERTLSFLAVGTNVKVRFPAVDQELTVPIGRINPAVDPRTRTVEVVAVIDNAGRKLKPGMLAEITIEPKGAAAPPSSSKTAKGAP
ncbi:MAG: efflux RND transporter periplasmic adaptor subunit [Polyangiaceae bacterium]